MDDLEVSINQNLRSYTQLWLFKTKVVPPRSPPNRSFENAIQ